MPDSIVFGTGDWWWIALAFLGAIAALTIWSYLARASSGGWANVIPILAKVIAVGAIAFCLLEPMRSSNRPVPGANIVAAIVDNSRSMEINPPGQADNYLAHFQRTLASDANWQTRLAQDFEFRKYAFDQRLRAIEDFSELDFKGNHSALADALNTLQSRFATRPVAGALLFSDGLATDDLNAIEATKFSFPIFPVVNAQRSDLQDISVNEPQSSSPHSNSLQQRSRPTFTA